MDTRDQEEVLALIRDRIVAAVRPRKIILFGSRARGDARPDSDYDILVVADGPLPRPRGARIHRALWGLTVPKDVIVCTPEEFATYSEWISTAIHKAAREGRVLYEAA